MVDKLNKKIRGERYKQTQMNVELSKCILETRTRKRKTKTAKNTRHVFSIATSTRITNPPYPSPPFPLFPPPHQRRRLERQQQQRVMLQLGHRHRAARVLVRRAFAGDRDARRGAHHHRVWARGEGETENGD